MNIKRWLEEDKGGLGAFLILLIMGLFFYALQQKHSLTYPEPGQTKTAAVTPTSLVVSRMPFSELMLPNSEPEEESESNDSNSTLGSLNSVKEADESTIKKAVSSASVKAKSKSTKRKFSKEDIVRGKLKAGMTVNKIAKATGYKRGDIRRIKKMQVCY